jgi:hypothetical protein
MSVGAVVVAMGVITNDELDSVPLAVRLEIETSAARLRARYPPEWFARERSRLRAELEFAYGATLSVPR